MNYSMPSKFYHQYFISHVFIWITDLKPQHAINPINIGIDFIVDSRSVDFRITAKAPRNQPNNLKSVTNLNSQRATRVTLKSYNAYIIKYFLKHDIQIIVVKVVKSYISVT